MFKRRQSYKRRGRLIRNSHQVQEQNPEIHFSKAYNLIELHLKNQVQIYFLFIASQE